ncbi:MAG: glycogen synthase GlgA [Acidobacteria bacterium]|nr:glycogen synthase GlgA [Acidobacteriota bacterium]
MRVLMAASEGVPYSKTGGLGDVVGALPQALAADGVEVAVVLPRHRSTKLEKSKELIPSLTVALGTRLHFPRVIEAPKTAKVRWIFVDYPPFFDRDSLYVGKDGKDYPDNPERFSLFSRAVLEIAKTVFPPDVIHCHDWQAGLTPVLLRTAYAQDPLLSEIPSVFTIHNLGYAGLFPSDALLRAGLGWELLTMDGLEFYGQVNFLKGALIYSSAVSTVSRKYALEIQTPEYGFGLEGVLRSRAGRVSGILNGVDYSEWDPAVDKLIAANYSAAELDGKKACKLDLLRAFGLPESDGAVPLIGIVSRFTRQKGADLIAEVADRLLSERIRLVALGTGEPEYEQLFRELATRFPERVAVRIAYDNVLAHKIEAGADMFLMPSHYEPCGLNQIYSLRYGTVPIVRATGGLDDTIEECDPATGEGTGFKFSNYTGAALLGAVSRALAVFGHSARWTKLMRKGMAKDFSWNRSAQEYRKLYEGLAHGTPAKAKIG